MAMALQLTNSIFSRHRYSDSRNRRVARLSVQAVPLETGDRRPTSDKSSSASLGFEETRERIAKLIHGAELSVSPYDTAWVAMVPSSHSLREPHFPDCVRWLLENQCEDGSWARPHHHRFLQRDVLSCTLACVLALKKWGVGQEKIDRGVHFIESNFVSVMDKNQISPLGFEIIFPGMLEHARDSHLHLHLDHKLSNDLTRKRDLELQRSLQTPMLSENSAYVAEGISKYQNWESILRYQRNNGSLFNSPSTTAAAFIHTKDNKCLDYLNSALKKFGKNAVPAIYPLDMYCRLQTIDILEKLGISSYFTNEIQSSLDEIYSSWLRGEEEIFMDASTWALAFRILRMNGYDVTSGSIMEFLQEDGQKKDIHTSLELYKASEVLLPEELHMQQHNLQLRRLLEEESSKGSIFSRQLGRNIDYEVNHVLDRPSYAILERVANRRNIEDYHFDSTRILKTSYSSPNFGNKNFLFMSAVDFNICQKAHQRELKQLERWVIENKLDELKFARSKAAYCYFSAAATIFSQEQADARISWAKNGVLTTVVDDFFDVAGSTEELEELIRLIEAWDVDVSKESSSKSVQIIFSALKKNILEIGDKARLRQGRDVTSHVIEIWLELLNAMMKEHEWGREKYLPRMSEYMSTAYVSFALGPIVLPALYLVGPEISEEMVRHQEYRNLFKLMSTCGRLLNDMRTYEREAEDGKLNAVPLYIINKGCHETKDEAIVEMKATIESHRRELLRLVLDEKDSVIPRPCKDLFWHMSTVAHFFYSKDDGFTSQDMFRVVNEMIHEPIDDVPGIY